MAGLVLKYNQTKSNFFETKMSIIYRWLAVALGVMLAAQIVPGIEVKNFWVALVVALVLSVLNVLLGWPIKILTFPLSLLTLGFFLLVVNAWVFWMASLVKGFYVAGFWPAFLGSLIVTLFSLIAKRLIPANQK